MGFLETPRNKPKFVCPVGSWLIPWFWGALWALGGFPFGGFWFRALWGTLGPVPPPAKGPELGARVGVVKKWALPKTLEIIFWALSPTIFPAPGFAQPFSQRESSGGPLGPGISFLGEWPPPRTQRTRESFPGAVGSPTHRGETLEKCRNSWFGPLGPSPEKF